MPSIGVLSLRISVYWNCQAVVCVYIIAGVGRLYVAYPYMGAMLRPENWDKHARDITPTSFLFPYVFVNK